jgi:hypothetical protein
VPWNLCVANFFLIDDDDEVRAIVHHLHRQPAFAVVLMLSPAITCLG